MKEIIGSKRDTNVSIPSFIEVKYREIFNKKVIVKNV